MNLDIDKMEHYLESELIDLPKHQTVEDRTQWLFDLMEKRKSGIALTFDVNSDPDEFTN